MRHDIIHISDVIIVACGYSRAVFLTRMYAYGRTVRVCPVSEIKRASGRIYLKFFCI